MRRLPVISTLIVLIAVGIMVFLGFWQIDRLDQKNTLLETYAANLDRPAIAYPELGPVANEAMFRKSAVNCLSVTDWRGGSGTAADGTKGFRYMVRCVTGAEGPGALINFGVGNRPNMEIEWQGGEVTGWITHAPSGSALQNSLGGEDSGPGPMLVSDKSMAGLKAPARPSLDDIPNNHFAYAVQWFLFALIALIIYFLAVRAMGKPESEA